MTRNSHKHRLVLGWREWIKLPDLKVKSIKAKIDTGAKSSSIHTFDLKTYSKHGKDFARFKILPMQRSDLRVVEAESEIVEFRNVKSSNGEVALRPVIETNITMLGKTWPIELTLASRDEMGFRMLLGRDAFRGRFLVDVSLSYLGGRPKRKKKKHGKKHGDSDPSSQSRS